MIEDYFKQNQVKDVTDMTVDEIRPVCNSIAEFCVRQIVNEITHMTVADIYDAQSNAAKKNKVTDIQVVASCEPTQIEQEQACICEESCAEKPRKGRRPRNYGGHLYQRRSDVPKSVPSEFVYMVYTRLNGERIGKMYGVIDRNLPREAAKNQLRTNYAKENDTHYLNVSMRMADSTRKFRQLKENSTIWTNEIAAAKRK